VPNSAALATASIRLLSDSDPEFDREIARSCDRGRQVVGGDNSDLLERWRQGDRQAGNQLIAGQFARIKRFFARKTNSRDVIEELMQRTFSRCVDRLDAFEGRSSFDTFIYGIARYVLLEYYRERRRSDRMVAVEETPVADLEPEPFMAVEGKENRKLLINALRRLSLDSQIIVELYFFEDLKGPQVREIMGLTEGELRSRVRAAKHTIQRHIKDFTNSPDLLKSTQMTLLTWARKIRDLHENTDDNSAQ